MGQGITYRSYAKINLYLDVVNRRRDGYHNIETIFQTVSLFDTQSFSKRTGGISLECSTAELDDGNANLAYRAASLLLDYTGANQGVYIYLRKHVPIAAGLAGGSGNAAAALVALNYLWDLDLSRAELQTLALELGSDVPYYLRGGTWAAARRGEELHPVPRLPLTWFVLVHPPLAISTSRVYNSPRLTRNTEPIFAGKTRSFRAAIRALAQGDLPGAVFNRMEGPVFADYPHLAEIRDRLLEAGCLAAAMSGSGPTLYGVCASRDHASHVAEAFPDYAVSVVYSVDQGVEPE